MSRCYPSSSFQYFTWRNPHYRKNIEGTFLPPRSWQSCAPVRPNVWPHFKAACCKTPVFPESLKGAADAWTQSKGGHVLKMTCNPIWAPASCLMGFPHRLVLFSFWTTHFTSAESVLLHRIIQVHLRLLLLLRQFFSCREQTAGFYNNTINTLSCCSDHTVSLWLDSKIKKAKALQRFSLVNLAIVLPQRGGKLSGGKWWLSQGTYTKSSWVIGSRCAGKPRAASCLCQGKHKWHTQGRDTRERPGKQTQAENTWRT